VDVCHCGEYYHRIWFRFSVLVDHREASHIGYEKNHGPPGFLDQAIVSFASLPTLLQESDIVFSSVIGAAAAQLAVFWHAYGHPDITSNLWLPTVCNQIVVFLSVLTACLPYLRPLMESLESGIVHVPEDAEELRSFARAGSRTN
jgi:hypothetical protein